MSERAVRIRARTPATSAGGAGCALDLTETLARIVKAAVGSPLMHEETQITALAQPSSTLSPASSTYPTCAVHPGGDETPLTHQRFAVNRCSQILPSKKLQSLVLPVLLAHKGHSSRLRPVPFRRGVLNEPHWQALCKPSVP